MDDREVQKKRLGLSIACGLIAGEGLMGMPPVAVLQRFALSPLSSAHLTFQHFCSKYEIHVKHHHRCPK